MRPIKTHISETITLKDRIDTLNISPYRFAKTVGLTPATVYRYINGQLKTPRLVNYCASLMVDLFYLRKNSIKKHKKKFDKEVAE